MSDDAPDTGSGLLDLVVFAAVTTISIAIGVVAGHALTERLKRKDSEQKVEMER